VSERTVSGRQAAGPHRTPYPNRPAWRAHQITHPLERSHVEAPVRIGRGNTLQTALISEPEKAKPGGAPRPHPLIETRHGITACVSEAAQPVRKHATGCHNRRQAYNGSAATAGDEHDPSERKGRLLQTLVIPGPNESCSSAVRRQRCRTPVSASNDATVRWQRYVSIRQEARNVGAPLRIDTGARASSRHEARLCRHDRPICSAALPTTHQHGARNVRVAGLCRPAAGARVYSMRRDNTEQSSRLASSAHQVGRKRDASGCCLARGQGARCDSWL
jgi:hypothetical protein